MKEPTTGGSATRCRYLSGYHEGSWSFISFSFISSGSVSVAQLYLYPGDAKEYNVLNLLVSGVRMNLYTVNGKDLQLT
jgi:hypothetical protein